MTTLRWPTGSPLIDEVPDLARLTIAVRSSGERVVIALRGELDVYTAENLRLVLNTALADESTDITVDMRALAFIDAAGVAVLTEASHQLNRDGRCLKVSHPSNMWEKVFRLIGLDYLIDYPNVRDLALDIAIRRGDEINPLASGQPTGDGIGKVIHPISQEAGVNPPDGQRLPFS